MLHSRNRKSNCERTHRAVVSVSVVLGLLAVSILALTTGSLSSAAADANRLTAAGERRNTRISTRGSASAPSVDFHFVGSAVS